MITPASESEGLNERATLRQKKSGCIYALIDPRDKEVRYIGQTIDLHHRFFLHVYTSKRGKKGHTNNWIRQLLALGQKPRFGVMEDRIPIEELTEREGYWINWYIDHGANLTNQVNPTNPPYFSEECRKRMSAKRKGTKSARFIDMTGKKIGRLTVLALSGFDNLGATWLCGCDCGNECFVRGIYLRQGDTRSCGCQMIDTSIKTIQKYNSHVTPRVTKDEAIEIRKMRKDGALRKEIAERFMLPIHQVDAVIYHRRWKDV